jgi:hypothetical protein
MELEPYIDDIRKHFAIAADAAGEEAWILAERLIAPLDAAVRLALQNALADAADEITLELAPGSVELRVRGRDLAFVVVLPPIEAQARDDTTAPAADVVPDDSGEMTRINVRMPENLKTRVEQAARAQGVSVNAWLVRAAGAAVDRADAAPQAEQRRSRGPQRYRGWAK